jgi:pimeloyl-ACP methyl ester carboxylesterase
MDILLIGGLWLDGSVWDTVAARLETLGHHAVPVTLPGQGDGKAAATLADQQATVVAAVDAAAGQPMVVGHSAASTLAWLAADARPGQVGQVVMIGGFPSPAGAEYNSFFPIKDGVMPFPSWDAFEPPDYADLDDAAKRALESAAIPVPEAVARGVITLTDERRYDVPVVLVCPEYSAADAQEWIKAGQIAELPKARAVSFIDIDSGHWPMITKPDELARLLAQAAGPS